MNTYVPFTLLCVAVITTLCEGSLPPGGQPSVYGRGYSNNDAAWRVDVGEQPHRAAPVPKQSDPLPPGWTEYFDQASGQPYYHNANDGATTWERPSLESAEPVPEEETGKDLNATEAESGGEQGASASAQPQIQGSTAGSSDSSEAPPGHSVYQVPEGQVLRTPEGSVLTGHTVDGEGGVVAERSGAPSEEAQANSGSPPGADSSGYEQRNPYSDQKAPPRAWGIPEQARPWGVDRPNAPAQDLVQSSDSGVSPTGFDGRRDPNSGPNQQHDQQIVSDESARKLGFPREEGQAGSPGQLGIVNVPKSPSEYMHGERPGQTVRPGDQSAMVAESRSPGNTQFTNQNGDGMNRPRDRPDSPHGVPPQPRFGRQDMYKSGMPPREHQSPPGTGGQFSPTNKQPHQRQQASSAHPDRFDPTRDGAPSQYNLHRDSTGSPTGNQHIRNPYPYQPPPQQHPNYYGPPRTAQRPPQQQRSPYDPYQYQNYRPTGQSPPQQPMQLVSQETTSAVRGALGSAWHGILGFRNRTKEAVETATNSVVNTAKGASQTISSTSTSLLGQARSTLGSFFEPSSDPQSPYSISGQPPVGSYPRGYAQTPGGQPHQSGGYPLPPQHPGAQYRPQYPGANHYNPPPGYPPRYPPEGTSGNSPPLQGQQQQQQPSRPDQTNPYPPGYRPPEARTDQPYVHDMNAGLGGVGPRQPPQRQLPPQTQWGMGMYAPPQGWQSQGGAARPPSGGEQQQKPPDKKDTEDRP